jgi:hypothetical protein
MEASAGSAGFGFHPHVMGLVESRHARPTLHRALPTGRPDEARQQERRDHDQQDQSSGLDDHGVSFRVDPG